MVELNIYEKLLVEAEEENIIVKEKSFESSLDGLYFNNKIALNKNTLVRNCEKACVLAEELGHHHKTYGNIIDLNNIDNIKQENKARLYAYDKLVGINGLVNAYSAGCRNLYDIADYLNVTEEFLSAAIEEYVCKYGEKPVSYEGYDIIFVPRFIVFKKL